MIKTLVLLFTLTPLPGQNIYQNYSLPLMKTFNDSVVSFGRWNRKDVHTYTTDEVIAQFQRTENQLFEFIQSVIASLTKLGKIRTAETYVSTLNSFMQFRENSDLRNGVLSYRRRKTEQQLFIKWEKCMHNITDKYTNDASPYLLPIIDPNSSLDERKQYIYAAHNVNKYLKTIGERIGVSMPLTMYCARHSWTSIAKSKNVPISVISEGMGHDLEATTRIYLASLDTMAIDKANSMILKLCK